MAKTNSCCVLFFVLALTVELALVHSQSQIGFISIDCGVSEDYVDNTTGISYKTDAAYIRSGENHEMESTYKATTNGEAQFNNVRSFPNGTRNCYTLVPQKGKNGTKYLIRARFMYGNYDLKSVLPEFDLYLGVNLWSNVNFTSEISVTSKELVQVIRSNVTYICLVNTGLGTPFISAIELRPLISGAYETQHDTIALQQRLDFGNEVKRIRFPDDAYDRIWMPRIWNSVMTTLSTNLIFDTGVPVSQFLTPTAVMGTAVTCINTSAPIEFFWRAPDQSYKFYSYMHFGEVEKLQPNQTREFVIKLNGLKTSSAIVPNYLYSTVMYDLKALTGDWFNYSIEQTANSTLPPIMNAIEFFFVKDFLQSETDEADVSAVKKIQTAYRVVKDWVADPCAPQNHAWNGIDCTFSNFDPPRIISLNLSSSGLTGKISDYISDLKLLQHLDLSNNNLTGSVPDFLSQMASLTVLNLNGNNLSGTVPSTLTEKSQQGSLLLSVEGNPNLCSSGSCTLTTTSKKTSALIPIIVSVVVVVVLLVIITIVIFWRAKRLIPIFKGRQEILHLGGKEDKVRSEPSDLSSRDYHHTTETDYSEHRAYTRNPSLGLKGRNKRFSFSDVLIMTNNFQKIIGEGGFGKVYYGILEDNSEVAVKVLNPSLSSEGYKQFHTEAEILMMVHHANLASMIGYCQEGKRLCVVYELMANGNLEDYLSPVKNTKFPSWEERLNIALDAAQGLEYLHHGCKPAIIHRDVKTTNILLDKALQAKFADFGISKIFPDDKCTHVSTGIKGTPGYLDPELFNCLNLNEKSDVYGFGVVLCEIITGQRAIIDVGSGMKDNITSWVSNIIAVNGDVRATVDRRLEKNYDVNSAWKLVETAIACISNPSSKRPTMNQVVIDIKQCLDMEKARKQHGGRRRNHFSHGVGQATFPNVSMTGPAPR
ncbi:unnamed protein product [Rhodiola kirilowii]